MPAPCSDENQQTEFIEESREDDQNNAVDVTKSTSEQHTNKIKSTEDAQPCDEEVNNVSGEHDKINGEVTTDLEDSVVTTQPDSVPDSEVENINQSNEKEITASDEKSSSEIVIVNKIDGSENEKTVYSTESVMDNQDTDHEKKETVDDEVDKRTSVGMNDADKVKLVDPQVVSDDDNHAKETGDTEVKNEQRGSTACEEDTSINIRASVVNSDDLDTVNKHEPDASNDRVDTRGTVSSEKTQDTCESNDGAKQGQVTPSDNLGTHTDRVPNLETSEISAEDKSEHRESENTDEAIQVETNTCGETHVSDKKQASSLSKDINKTQRDSLSEGTEERLKSSLGSVNIIAEQQEPSTAQNDKNVDNEPEQMCDAQLKDEIESGIKSLEKSSDQLKANNDNSGDDVIRSGDQNESPVKCEGDEKPESKPINENSDVTIDRSSDGKQSPIKCDDETTVTSMIVNENSINNVHHLSDETCASTDNNDLEKRNENTKDDIEKTNSKSISNDTENCNAHEESPKIDVESQAMIIDGNVDINKKQNVTSENSNDSKSDENNANIDNTKDNAKSECQHWDNPVGGEPVSSKVENSKTDPHSNHVYDDNKGRTNVENIPDETEIDNSTVEIRDTEVVESPHELDGMSTASKSAQIQKTKSISDKEHNVQVMTEAPLVSADQSGHDSSSRSEGTVSDPVAVETDVTAQDQERIDSNTTNDDSLNVTAEVTPTDDEVFIDNKTTQSTDRAKQQSKLSTAEEEMVSLNLTENLDVHKDIEIPTVHHDYKMADEKDEVDDDASTDVRKHAAFHEQLLHQKDVEAQEKCHSKELPSVHQEYKVTETDVDEISEEAQPDDILIEKTTVTSTPDEETRPDFIGHNQTYDDELKQTVELESVNQHDQDQEEDLTSEQIDTENQQPDDGASDSDHGEKVTQEGEDQDGMSEPEVPATEGSQSKQNDANRAQSQQAENDDVINTENNDVISAENDDGIIAESDDVIDQFKSEIDLLQSQIVKRETEQETLIGETDDDSHVINDIDEESIKSSSIVEHSSQTNNTTPNFIYKETSSSKKSKPKSVEESTVTNLNSNAQDSSEQNIESDFTSAIPIIVEKADKYTETESVEKVVMVTVETQVPSIERQTVTPVLQEPPQSPGVRLRKCSHPGVHRSKSRDKTSPESGDDATDSVATEQSPCIDVQPLPQLSFVPKSKKVKVVELLETVIRQSNVDQGIQTDEIPPPVSHDKAIITEDPPKIKMKSVAMETVPEEPLKTDCTAMQTIATETETRSIQTQPPDTRPMSIQTEPLPVPKTKSTAVQVTLEVAKPTPAPVAAAVAPKVKPQARVEPAMDPFVAALNAAATMNDSDSDEPLCKRLTENIFSESTDEDDEDTHVPYKIDVLKNGYSFVEEEHGTHKHLCSFFLNLLFQE